MYHNSHKILVSVNGIADGEDPDLTQCSYWSSPVRVHIACSCLSENLGSSRHINVRSNIIL